MYGVNGIIVEGTLITTIYIFSVENSKTQTK